MLTSLLDMADQFSAGIGFSSRPHFLIIGAQKAGTTSLHDLLSQHPSLVPPRQKELHYFDDAKIPYGKTSAYHRMFPSRLRTDCHRRLTFETTPSYLYDTRCPQRIFGYSPSIKLVAVLREPVSRAYSAWRMYHDFSKSPDETIRRMGDARQFDAAVEEELERWQTTTWQNDKHAYVTRGLYVDQLERYLKYFELGTSLFVCGYEQLFAAPERVLGDLTDFLEVPQFQPFGIPHSNAGKTGFCRMPELTFLKLRKFYEPFNQRLYDLVGHDFPWT